MPKTNPEAMVRQQQEEGPMDHMAEVGCGGH